MMPWARIETASSSSLSGWNTVRGCRGLGLIASIGRVFGRGSRAGAGAIAEGTAGALGGGPTWVGRTGKSAERPLPSALRGLSSALFIGEDLLGEFNIALGAT